MAHEYNISMSVGIERRKSASGGRERTEPGQEVLSEGEA